MKRPKKNPKRKIVARHVLLGLTLFATVVAVSNSWSDESSRQVAATPQYILEVQNGIKLKDEFLDQCKRSTNAEKWCLQVIRGNPERENVFDRIFGREMPHQLIHPDKKTWKYAIGAVSLVDQLERKGVRVVQIYNWWRPAKYNRAVGGAAGRHPFGTSVDVRFQSPREAVRAFDLLCKARKAGKVRALGYYGNSGVHIGVGDHNPNTWGRGCR